MAKSLLSFLAVAAQLSAASEVASHRVLYVDAEVKGEEYRRLNEPMPQFVAEATTCPTTQVIECFNPDYISNCIDAFKDSM